MGMLLGQSPYSSCLRVSVKKTQLLTRKSQQTTTGQAKGFKRHMGMLLGQSPYSSCLRVSVKKTQLLTRKSQQTTAGQAKGFKRHTGMLLEQPPYSSGLRMAKKTQLLTGKSQLTDLSEQNIVEEQLGFFLVLGDVSIVMHAKDVRRGVDGQVACVLHVGLQLKWQKDRGRVDFACQSSTHTKIIFTSPNDSYPKEKYILSLSSSEKAKTRKSPENSCSQGQYIFSGFLSCSPLPLKMAQ